jgi:glyoxylase-like metal-dependent hydrolase (beta-lactamase superfamily II)
MRGPIGWFERAEGRTAALKALGIGVRAEDMVDVPIVAFLLEHPSAGPVLVDTGFHRCVADRSSAERSRNLGSVGRLLARAVRMRPEQAVAAQLGQLGVAPGDVGVIVMTHLHFDHASALCDFPSATVLVARPEWEAALGRAPFMHGYSRAQLDPRPRYRTVDFTADASADGGSFEATADVFGDGSVRLAFTPGHSLGHLSVIVRLQSGEALLTGDAVYTMRTLTDGVRPWRCEDAHAFEHSLGQIAAWQREHSGALLIPGHDMQAWEGLQEVYR